MSVSTILHHHHHHCYASLHNVHVCMRTNNTVAFISDPYLALLLFINHRQFVICLFTHSKILGKINTNHMKKVLEIYD